MDSFNCNGYSQRHMVSDIEYILFSRIRDYGELLLYSSLFLGLAAVGMAYTPVSFRESPAQAISQWSCS